ncbi:MAG TPA: TraR/DksA family transcriptional regulator [Rhabdochlamydiaceae bacterium]|nr:TraR/DksA family transcriptional regulator [Rhabdochlamydiaceae bacterium]
MALKKADLARFKKRLEELRDQMTNILRDTTEDVKSIEETKGYSQHQADEGTDDFNRTISLELSTQEFTVLRQIERALEKIDENTYGICDITGEEIPIQRLEAVPYATMTVKAQEKFEKGLL